MAINLKTLIKLAPFKEENKTLLIENLDKLTEDEKYNLSNSAWTALSLMYYGRLEVEKRFMTEEEVLGTRKVEPNDYQELEAKILHEFAQKLESVQSQEAIEEVKQQLEKFKTK